jgi:hypothetical protein
MTIVGVLVHEAEISELTWPAVVHWRSRRCWRIATVLRVHLQKEIDLSLEVRERVVCHRKLGPGERLELLHQPVHGVTDDHGEQPPGPAIGPGVPGL